LTSPPLGFILDLEVKSTWEMNHKWVGGWPESLMHLFELCTSFCIRSHTLGTCALFRSFWLAHVHVLPLHSERMLILWLVVYVCALWKCIFCAMDELIGVWRCWIPITICGRYFSDNRCPLMYEVRSIRIAKICQCFLYWEYLCNKSVEGSYKRDPLEGEGNQ